MKMKRLIFPVLPIVCLLVLSTAASAGGPKLELSFWSPSMTGVDEVGAIVFGELYDDATASYTQRNTVYWLRPSAGVRSMRPILSGSMELGPDWTVCGSYWTYSGEATIDPLVLGGPWTDEGNYGMLVSTDPKYIVSGFGGEDMWVSSWDWDHYDYELGKWVGRSLGLFLKGSEDVSLSSLDIGVERDLVRSNAATVTGFLGVKRAVWSASSDITMADLGGMYDTYPEDYEFNWQRLVRTVNATMLGPALSVSGHFCKGNFGIRVKLGYAYLPWGSATQTVDRKRGSDTYSEGSLVSSSTDESYLFEHVFSPSTQVLDFETGVTYRVTKNLLATVGLKKSTWYGAPAILTIDPVLWGYEVSAGSTSTISVEGLTVGLVYSF